MKKQPWMGNVIATTVGWVNSHTNEIMATVKDLPDAVPYQPTGNYNVITGDQPTSARKKRGK